MTRAAGAGTPILPPDWLAWMARHPPTSGPSGADWVRSLPGLLDEALGRWRLTVTGPAWTGWTAVVFPVQRDADALVLKVGWPHPEAAAEHLALQVWAGRGAVRLVAADPARGALLLERLDADRDLRSLPIDQACTTIGTVLRELHVPAPPNVPTVAEFVEHHLEGHDRRDGEPGGVPRRMLARSRGLARELRADLGDPAQLRLLHTDLHFRNVLRGSRAEGPTWLAIDPKPMAGHPGFELQPVLRNRADELGGSGSFRAAVRRRLALVADAAGVEEEAMRLWSLVHTGLQLRWAAADSDHDALSLQVALFKALDGDRRLTAPRSSRPASVNRSPTPSQTAHPGRV